MHHKNMKSSASPSGKNLFWQYLLPLVVPLHNLSSLLILSLVAGQEGKLHLSPAMRDICSRVKSDMKGESHLPVDENNRVSNPPFKSNYIPWQLRSCFGVL